MVSGYSVSFEAVGSLLSITKYHIELADGNYENAFKLIQQGLSHIQTAYTLYHIPGFPRLDIGFMQVPSIPYTSTPDSHSDFRSSFPWFKELTMQEIVNCFEKIRTSPKIQDLEGISDVCEYLEYNAGASWLYRDDDKSIKDSEGYYWETAESYWRHYIGLARRSIHSV